MRLSCASIFIRAIHALLGLAVGMAVAGRAGAESVGDFYAGKQIKFIIRSAPGGGYDLFGRLIGEHMVRHIPGRPSFVPQNMPGGGGIIAANYMAKVAAQDGTYVTIVGDALPMDQALGLTPSFKVDLRTFGWIGNFENSNLVTYTIASSPTKSMDDAKVRETTIGATGSGSPTSWFPIVLNRLLGTKFKLIPGYKSASDVLFAMERNEVEGYSAHPWASLVSAFPDMVAHHRLSMLVQIGLEREADLPDVPLLPEFATTADERAVLDFITKAFAAGRPIATTPGVPPDRLAILRRAFDETVADPAFKVAAEKAGAAVKPIQGQVIASLIGDVLGAPQPIKDRVRSLLPDRSE